MKFSYLLSLIVALFIFNGCAKPPDIVLDSFEGELNSKTVDFGSSRNSELLVSADKGFKICGKQALKLDYNLLPSGYMWAARGTGLDAKAADKWLVKSEDIKWKKYNAISLQMYGSNTGSIVAFDFKDAKGELWRFLLDDDFTGWKEIICPLKEFFPRSDWQPDTATKDDILDFPLKSFQFEPRALGKNVYRFDCIKVIKAKK